MSPLNGKPQPGRYRKLGGKRRRPRRGCVPVLIVALAGPWLIDLLLTASTTTG